MDHEEVWCLLLAHLCAMSLMFAPPPVLEHWAKLALAYEVRRKVNVKGIKSFKPERTKCDQQQSHAAWHGCRMPLR